MLPRFCVCLFANQHGVDVAAFSWDPLQVLLAGGAVSSPQVLMLSGVGPAEHLQSKVKFTWNGVV